MPQEELGAKFHIQIYDYSNQPCFVPIEQHTTALLALAQVEHGRNLNELAPFSLLKVKRNHSGVVVSKEILPPQFQMSTLEKVVADDPNHQLNSFYVVRSANAVNVFFNVYFRMVSGCPVTQMTYYLHESSSVGKLESAIKQSLNIGSKDTRFGLFGCTSPEQPLRRLSPLETAMALRNSQNRYFFQFQVIDDNQDQSGLGVSIADTLTELKLNMMIQQKKPRWCVLKGTSLFIHRNTEHQPLLKEIKNIHRADLKYTRSIDRSSGLYLINITTDECRVTLGDPSEVKVQKWIKKLTLSQPVSEIRAVCNGNSEIRPKIVEDSSRSSSSGTLNSDPPISLSNPNNPEDSISSSSVESDILANYQTDTLAEQVSDSESFLDLYSDHFDAKVATISEEPNILDLYC